MLGKLFVELDCKDISLHKHTDQIVIRIKAQVIHSHYTHPSIQDLAIKNRELIPDL